MSWMVSDCLLCSGAFNPAGHKPVDGRSQRIPVRIFCQVIDIDAVNRIVIDQAESMGNQNGS